MSSQGFMSKIALPYAEALVESASSASALDQINQDLSLISEILNQSQELKTFFYNPLITTEIKKNVVSSLFTNQVHSLVIRFLLVLIDRRRIALLDVIISKYLELVYQLQSTVIAEVLTPVLLTDVQQSALINKIKDMTNSKTVKLVITIKPMLIAGFIIKIGSKTIDTSLYGRLKHISAYLNAVS
uniref:ATP synthase subunit delta, chloroplastic n=1 Tax=Gracilaria tenuistipitata var. liui TaxID=285951 RepID=ATPD_GRATL|nr:ATP synthase CF1 delta subunit [Gracilaria tenuistipitata var. liui]Q6B8Q9.1 RecName: Full=ATP synthase subunit delta, chloroplastic; AltName: Full=ATP synthase F(1) sector subunit delta; AltName: Full=F-type ATPase subunit delta [Gracilaria tenuistipitata var. liui]AAT79726.1 ATP synthase CF1 delta subunit [Gracilaria tenuistipitata var. liui]